jgi:heme/copper-type cytochrome/quinol oxidase subunit 4
MLKFIPSGKHQMPLRIIRGIFQDGRTTIRGWATYKGQTGTVPWFAIAACSLNWIVVVSAIFLLMTFGSDYRWSRWRIALIVALVAVPYIILWSWITNKAKLNQLRTPDASREKQCAECLP